MLDNHFRILADVHRRQILTSLLEEDTHSVYPVRSDGGGEDGDAEKRQRKRIELRHVHLPKLAESGVVDWNRESDTVTRGPQFEEIEPVLKLLANGHGEFVESRVG